MSKLFVITFKRPALPVEKTTMQLETAYDCEVLPSDEIAQIALKNALNKYEDVHMFTCEDCDYLEFIKQPDVYRDFILTGKHSLAPADNIEESVDANVDVYSKTINLKLTLERKNSNSSFNYTASIDDAGMIVLTPLESDVSFIDVDWVEGGCTDQDIIDNNIKTTCVQLNTTMISDEKDYNCFFDIDDIGQVLIVPKSDTTSFLTVTVDNSLNLVTNNSDATQINESTSDIKDLCSQVVDDLESLLTSSIQKAKKIEQYFDSLNIHSADIEPYMVNYLESFVDGADVSVSEFRRRLDELSECKNTLTETITDIERNDIINKFMRGEIDFYSDEGTPDPKFIHLQELDTVKGNHVYEYYYDESTNSVVFYSRIKDDQDA